MKLFDRAATGVAAPMPLPGREALFDLLREELRGDNSLANQAKACMMSAVTNTVIRILVSSLALCVIARAQCPVDTVVIKGRIIEIANASKVRVQLVYVKEKRGESGDVTVHDGTFQIPIEFMTMQSSISNIFSNLPKRCGRKPKTVIITLLENDQESDQVVLDFVKNFKATKDLMTNANVYTLRSELVLKAPR